MAVWTPGRLKVNQHIIATVFEKKKPCWKFWRKAKIRFVFSDNEETPTIPNGYKYDKNAGHIDGLNKVFDTKEKS